MDPAQLCIVASDADAKLIKATSLSSALIRSNKPTPLHRTSSRRIPFRLLGGMPQTTLQYIRGYVQLTADTLTQRLRLPQTPEHPIFQADGEYLLNKTAIVTGANTGIGLETTRMLAGAGATVILACRSLDRANKAAEDVRGTHPGAKLEVMRLDLADMASVRAFADGLAERGVDILVLNGGIMGADRTEPETHFMVNHVGHVLLTLRLMRCLRKAAGRIVLVSSLTYLISDLRLDDISFEHRRYNWMTAYANSKLCMLLFMHALHPRIQGSGITVNAVHPGEATSDVARNLGQVWYGLHKNVGKLFLLNIQESARTSVYVAGAREVTSGRKIYHRVDQPLSIPERLVNQDDVRRAWDITMLAAEATNDDIAGLEEIVVETEIDGGNNLEEDSRKQQAVEKQPAKKGIRVETKNT